MSKCLLSGHTPIERAGVGEFKGRTFMVCAECGNTLAEFDPNPKQTLADLVDVMDYNEAINIVGRAPTPLLETLLFEPSESETWTYKPSTRLPQGYHRNG